MASCSKQASSRFRWTAELIVDLIESLQAYKAVCEYKGIDFNGDKVKQYEEVRRSLTKKHENDPSLFGLVAPSDRPAEFDEFDEKEKEETNKRSLKERGIIKRGYNRVLEKIKDIRQKFSTAVTTGCRSGSGKIVLEHFDTLVLIWGGSPAAEPLSYGIDSDFLNNDNNPNSSSSDLSSNVSNSNIGSPSAVLPPSTLTSLGLDKDDYDSDSSISTEMSGQPSNPVPKLIDEKRKHLQKKLSAAERDRIFLDESREDAQFKRDLADAIRQSNEVFAKSTSELSKSMAEMASGITASIQMLSQALCNQPHPMAMPYMHHNANTYAQPQHNTVRYQPYQVQRSNEFTDHLDSTLNNETMNSN